ncbi:type II toxin-antitoxin system RelE/ParE family toxin [Flavobacterium sp.]|uniref:type II toxin-antitoxin system RelE/ParE family toxin n=1 Tax=Flavobacterium sp. TaxID=239 RepID=UPI0040475C85
MDIRELEFSQRSLREIEAISEYIEFKWSNKSKEEFLKLLKKNIDLIEHNPNLFQITNYKNVYRCVVSKQTSIYFKFNNYKISIVSVFDTRQNPNKIQ